MSPLRRTASRPALAVTFAAVWALALSCALAGAPAAGAHGGPGNIALDSFTPKGGGTYEIKVKLTYAEDGDAVSEATVTLSGAGPEGQKLTPVSLSAQGEGVFATTTTLPAGVWNLTITSVEPQAQLALEPITVADPGPGATSPGGSAGSSSSSTTAAGGSGGTTQTTEGRVSALDGTSSTTVAGSEEAGSSSKSKSESKSDSKDNGSDVSWPLVLGAAAVMGVLLVLGVRQYFRAKAEGPGLDSVDDGTGDDA